MLIEMRPPFLSKGLIELINYIGTIRSTFEMNMIEIGCYSGESTIIFSDYFKNVITIDPLESNYHESDSASKSDFQMVYDVLMNRIKYRKNITLIKKKSDDAFNMIEDFVDFVYIDGMHTYDQVSKDIQNYKQIIKNNGFIGGHDYVDGWKEVKKAVDENIGAVDIVFSDFSWIKKIVK